MAFRDPWNGMVGGGDLATNDSADAATSNDGGHTWTLKNKPPVRGSIFCLAYVRGIRHGNVEEGDQEHDHAVVVTAEMAPNFNTGSAAWTPDEGRTWFALPGVSGYWAVAFANPKAGWFVGNGGRILKDKLLTPGEVAEHALRDTGILQWNIWLNTNSLRAA